MENKYYTPSIEDIRVGYECETQVDPYPYWVKTIIENGDCLNFIIEKDWQIRTSYLTKEQIEAEGWEYTHHNRFIKDVYYLDFDRTGLLISYGEGTYCYDGACPSINEFRTIIKLLNIK